MRPRFAGALGALLLCSCESAFSGLVRPNPDDCTVSPCPEPLQCNQRTHRCEPTATPDGGAADAMPDETCLAVDQVPVHFNKVGVTTTQVGVKVSVNGGQGQIYALPVTVPVCPKSRLAVRAITPERTCLTAWEVLKCPEGGVCPSVQSTSAQLNVATPEALRINAMLSTCALRVVNNGGAENLRDVSGAGDTIYIAGEKGGLRRWDGTALTPVTIGATDLQGLAFHDRDQGLLVGGAVALHMTAPNTASGLLLPRADVILRGVALTSKGLGWMVGGGALGTALALRWDGVQVTDESPAGKNTLEAVSGAGTEFWTVGAGSVFQHIGAGWIDRAVLIDKSHLLHGVFVSPWGEVWLVGEKGLVLRGGEKGFAPIKGSVNENLTVPLRDAWGSSQEDVWFVGDKDAGGGVILRWNGTSFSRFSLPGSGSFSGVWGLGPADVWFVGEAGTIYRYSPIS